MHRPDFWRARLPVHPRPQPVLRQVDAACRRRGRVSFASLQNGMRRAALLGCHLGGRPLPIVCIPRASSNA